MTAADLAAISAHLDWCGCGLPFIAAPGWPLPFAHVVELGHDLPAGANAWREEPVR